MQQKTEKKKIVGRNNKYLRKKEKIERKKDKRERMEQIKKVQDNHYVKMKFRIKVIDT